MQITYRVLSVCAELIVLLCSTVKGASYSEGQWSPWGALSPCSVTCGLGTMSMERFWIQGPDEAPSLVPYTSTQVFPCTNEVFPECPQDGEWSGWMLWSSCTKACGGGLRERQRECRGQFYGGKYCEGESFDKEECGRPPCPPLPKNVDLSQCKGSSNFTCTSQKMCVPLAQKCDSLVQCHDGSDEENCVDPTLLWGGSIRYDISIWRNDAVSTFTSTIVTLTMIPALLLILLFH